MFLGSATGFWERTHLSVVEPSDDSLVQRGLRLVVDLICFVICVVLVWFGYRYAVAGLGRISPSMGFKMAFVYAWVPATFALSAYFIVVRWLGVSK
ncbi:MAG: TRAP transporter small permease subunit [Aquamicrobium sp.]|nr:TRAP transporter small permease subunit [Aquamicrobium sp.]MCO5158569.1 TRAP transporter small permease subunit [Aquamicrobium sp.]